MRQFGIGAAIGAVVAGMAVFTLRHARLPSAGLYPVASLAFGALAYGGADVLHGSGFLAVYMTGLAIGSSPSPAQRTIATFHDGLAWVAQLVLFLVLGLLVFPNQLGSVAVKGSTLALIVAVVARPVAVMVATAFAGFTLPERAVLGWAGLRGAVPVVLAIFPVIDGVPHSHEFFNIIFFAVLVSTIVQGTTFEPFARWLGVTTAEAALPAPLIESTAIRRLGAEVVEFVVEPDHAAAGRRVRELGLPRDALLNIIIRGGQALPPRGSTRIEPGDHLHVLVRQEAAVDFRPLLDRWRDGPLGRAAPPKAGSRPARRRRSSRAGLGRRGTATRPGPARRRRSTWSTSCERAATIPARSWCCPTAATRTPARSRRSALPVRSRTPPAGGCASLRPTPSRPGGGRSSGRWRIREPPVGQIRG